MAQSETEVRTTTEPEPAVAQQQSLAQPPVEEVSEIQAALLGLHTRFIALSQEFQAEQKVLAIMARKSPEEVARELPRRIAGTTVRRLSEAFGTLSQVVAVFATVEERVSILEATDDLGAVVGSPDDLHDFLADVVELCTSMAGFAVTDGDKELLARVREQAEGMLGRMDEGDEGDEEPDESEEPDAEEVEASSAPELLATAEEESDAT